MREEPIVADAGRLIAMLFSSWYFILIFLPLTFAGYFLLNHLRLVSVAKVWLVSANLLFYGFWDYRYLPIIICSILFNFTIGGRINPQVARVRYRLSHGALLTCGIVANLLLLGYFKYVDFFIGNVNALIGSNYSFLSIALPLGISFFTFQQIDYLVDSYRGKTKEYRLLNYALFVTFFPHLIAGPIVHHDDIMSQLTSRWRWIVRYPYILRGLFAFSIGLFKKVVIADTLALWANWGFDQSAELDFFSAWGTSLAYTFQLYFDFSGYCDMAIGAALLFNIWLPINFNSPYKALTIQDFWRRWHMTLSRFLRDYLYIPLGGNRGSDLRTCLSIMLTFSLGGLWHGASWLFVAWGALHGVALVVQRTWSGIGWRMPKVVAWTMTFLFVNAGWVIFRAKRWEDARKVFYGMLDIRTAVSLPVASIEVSHLAWGGFGMDTLLSIFPTGVAINFLLFVFLGAASFVLSRSNTFEMARGEMTAWKVYGAIPLLSIGILCAIASTSKVFLYFNF